MVRDVRTVLGKLRRTSTNSGRQPCGSFNSPLVKTWRSHVLPRTLILCLSTVNNCSSVMDSPKILSRGNDLKRGRPCSMRSNNKPKVSYLQQLLTISSTRGAPLYGLNGAYQSASFRMVLKCMNDVATATTPGLNADKRVKLYSQDPEKW